LRSRSLSERDRQLVLEIVRQFRMPGDAIDL